MRAEPHLRVLPGAGAEDMQPAAAPEELERLERVVAVGLLVEEVALRLGTTLDKALRRLLVLSGHSRDLDDIED